jgi:hypothetical protein
MLSTLALFLCPLLAAQQPQRAASAAATAQPALAGQAANDMPPANFIAERNQAIKGAETVCIRSRTAFITVSTFDRALMKQKNWNQLGLNIVASPDCSGDLQIDLDRLIFTHIHTYVVTDTKSGFVLASGRVTALDGIVASGPMAEQIVKLLSAARLPAQTPGGASGL